MQTYKRAKQIATAATIRSSRRLCVTACLLALFALPWPARSVHLGPLTTVSTIDFKGNNVTFSVSTAGGTPMNYRWFFNQTNLLASGTNSFLSLTNVQLTNAGNYSVIVTNWFNGVTSTPPASLIVYTDATPTLSVPSNSTNGQFQFSITGVTGLNYTVLASTNLVDWIPLKTNISPFNFVDTNVILFPQRFYRSVYLP